MPDLQSELAKLANAWDSHEQIIRNPETTKEKTMQTNQTPLAITKTGNLSRDLFNCAQQRLQTRVQLSDAMESVGYNKVSARSLITQMIRAGVMAYQGDVLITLIPEYAPVGNPSKPSPQRTYTRKNLLKPVKPIKTPKAAGLAALPVTKEEAPQQPTPARLVRMQTATEVLANMSVVEAHKLYVELAKIFGGK